MNKESSAGKESKELSVVDLLPIITLVLESGGEFCLTPKGTSMNPLIKQGAGVILAKPTSLKKQDIIFYKRGDKQFVLHRIVKVHNGVYDTCGDNQFIIEKFVKYDQIIAKVVGIKIDNKSVNMQGFSYKTYTKTLVFRRFRKRMRNMILRGCLKAKKVLRIR